MHMTHNQEIGTLTSSHGETRSVEASKLSGNLFEQGRRNSRVAEAVCILPQEQHSQPHTLP